jgi:hypothetical protein
MVTSEFEEALESLTDAELLRQAIKYLRMVYLELEHASDHDDAQEALDYVYMECSRRGKEWIFDKAQDACLRQGSSGGASSSLSEMESA